MKTRFKRVFLLPLVVASLLTATGCVERVVERPAPPAHVVYVPSPPPADVVEIQPPPPDGNPYWVWQKGHWRWASGGYYWVHGHWVQRPPHYSGWVPPHWENRGGAWFFAEGHWQ